MSDQPKEEITDADAIIEAVRFRLVTAVRKECASCRRSPALDGERYCPRCRLAVLAHLESVGYLRPVVRDCRRYRDVDAREEQGDSFRRRQCRGRPR